ncbi:LysR family transcriptional regulator [Devosia sp. Root436]|jgi:DNA-binding transcriptional LysR family regulator|uniref:LysR family transcriptional regulator n=1 Tax=Devosia sp. Root436 TaxID=1736537 RepID=UPI0006FBE29D|nr:LysR family transcriptional regulator [Devosia sp. Root436]KQX35228.1 LysR family transcriptional regulator [Devosia sp. Root436]
MKQPDWNHLRAFLVTVETGSLSAAARGLGLTQPTLGRQVAALEQELGILLFERVGRSLALTVAGRELFESARTMGEVAGRLPIIASGQSQSVEGLVRITASDIVAAHTLPAILKQMHEIAPGIAVEIVAANDVRDLIRREADIAIRHVRPEQPDLIARRCRGTTAHLYGATSYLDTHGRPRSGADLADASFIGYSEADGLVAELNARGVPVTRASFKWSTGSVVTAWEMIRQGLGLGVMFRDVAEGAPGVEAVLPELAPFEVPIWLAVHRELHTSRRIRLVFDLLAEALG